jgi:hypothetical protein
LRHEARDWRPKVQAEGIARQRDVFRSQGSNAREHKTAYLLIDALRYEMAEELVEGLLFWRFNH